MNEYEQLLDDIAEKSAKAAELALSDKEEDTEQAEALLAEVEALEARAVQVKRALDAKARADEAKAALPRPETPGYSISGDTLTGGEPREVDKPYTWGEFAHDVARLYIHKSTTPRLSQHIKAVSGASEAVPTDGGILVGEDLMDGLITPMYETGAILSRVRQITISANSNSTKMYGVNETSRATGSRWGGVRGYWLAEADQITSSKPAFREIRLNLFRLGALVYATDELLTDAAVLTSVINQAVPLELQFLVENAIINGTGSGQPEGILNCNALASQAKETGQAADTIVFENIINMWARMYAPHRRNAVWLINQECEPQLYTMALDVGTGGLPAYLPPGGLSASPYGTLLGRPVIATEYNQEVGTVGDIMLVDLSQYLMATKGGIQAAQSIHLRFDYDESVFRFIYRVDGKSAWSSVLTPFETTGSGNTLSPFVALATRD